MPIDEVLRFRSILRCNKKIPIKPITRILVTVPIIQRGILPVVSAIYPTSLQISSSGHARDINSLG
ncbi:hypothetical protein KY290_008227 [Solanum tuberosum]|uniref:Uncharacterized protein n=1 Tax=Solanum tuberosum TaxID=4113 RepID=A0ABQ7W7U3_SOLTU|nr:hypothetical protein KY290_008227 [Solanum tuberosum]